MSAPFDWEREIIAAFRAPNLARTVEHLRTHIEAAFVPVGTVATVDAALARATARAEAAEARNKVLEEALVEAAIPLHAMRLAGTVENFSPEMREGVENAVQRINQALGATHD